MGDPHWTSLEQFVENCLPHAGTGKEHEEEEIAQTTHYGLTTTPIPHAPALPGGGGRRVGSEIVPGKKGGVGEGGFVLISYTGINWQ